jgi:hypothetical protein
MNTLKEVSEEKYYEMLGVLPPEEMGKTRHDFIDLPIAVQSYFLVGEPVGHNEKGQALFDCYAQVGEKYYYIGLKTLKRHA